jgi:hypothetical protein
MLFQFVSINEPTWGCVRAAEESLSVSELVSKSGLEEYEVSRILKQIKNQSIGIRLSFEIRLEKAGILNIAVISRRDLKEVPYAQAKRMLRVLGQRLFLYTGMVPLKDSAIEEWLSTFEDSALVVRALERKWWRANATATVYNEGWVYGNVESVKVTDKSQPVLPAGKEVKLDYIDVFLLWAKHRWPFTSLREAEGESEKYLGRRVSHQVLSYHFRNHVLKLWAGNRVWLYADAQQVPYRLLYLEGRDAPAVARALVQLPWFHTAYIDVGKAVVSGQPPCASMPHLYRVLGDLDVDVVEFAMEVGVLKWVPIFNLLGQFVKREEVEAGRGVAAR